MEHSAIPQALARMQPFWGAWHIDAYIGSGTFGKVYRIVREDMDEKFHAALKWLPLPKDEEELLRLKQEGMSLPNIDTYYKNMVNDLRREIKLLSELKGNSHIVSYEDHLTRKRPDDTGWDILIRMELLTPLNTWLASRGDSVTVRDVIQMGIHLCNALTLCQKNNILHRDIKPENIFVSANDQYKLGDFGIARKIEAVSDKMSRVGTPPYMAPEVYRDSAYGSTVDLYSLGLVMYKLLNNRREPFLPAAPEAFTPSQEENARLRRMKGDLLPNPRHGSEALWTILQRACAAMPKDRYSSPLQMQKELEAILYDPQMEKSIFPEGDGVILPGWPEPPSGKRERSGTIKLEQGEPYPKEEELPSESNHPLLSSGGDEPLRPSIPQRKEKGKKNRNILIAASVPVLIAVIFALVLLLNAPHLDDLIANRAAAGSLTLAWSDNRSGPWTITYAQKDLPLLIHTVHTDKPSAELSQLIPGISYVITAANDTTGSNSTTTSVTSFAPKAPSELIQLIGEMRCYAYLRTDYSNALEAYNNNRISALHGFSFSTTQKPAKSQENGYIVSYYLRFAQSFFNQSVMVTTVLRFPENGAFQVANAIPVSAVQGDLITDMDTLFDQVWAACGKWPQEEASLELYVNDWLISEQKCVIKTDPPGSGGI